MLTVDQSNLAWVINMQLIGRYMKFDQQYGNTSLQAMTSGRKQMEADFTVILRNTKQELLQDNDFRRIIQNTQGLQDDPIKGMIFTKSISEAYRILGLGLPWQ